MKPAPADWLNYHHLIYFWHVARHGSVSAAARELHLAQPTVSAQIGALERAVGGRLFERAGRGLRLSDLGRTVLRFADEIAWLGRELLDTLRDRPVGNPVQIQIGVADVVPKIVAHELIAPAVRMPEPVRVVCYESTHAELLARLAIYDLDVVISDAPVTSQVRVRAFSHLLGECGVSFLASRSLRRRLRRPFPQALDAAPFLLPTANTALRRSLERWFDEVGVRPNVVGEFEDSALLKVFAESGAGVFAAPDVVRARVAAQYGLVAVGRTDAIREEFYCISTERRVTHPAVLAITSAARGTLFRRPL
ncbi:MAG: Transcriptional activator protein NhaR [Phycisphaerae bacterium]|nr:Transcriptional activator protein NhaR [Phycisphaerae bacterium]